VFWNEPTPLLLPFQIKPEYGLISNWVDPGLGIGLGLGQGAGLQVPCANNEDDANTKANRTRKMKNLILILIDHLHLGLDHFTSCNRRNLLRSSASRKLLTLE
jgi:hypothetical protein